MVTSGSVELLTFIEQSNSVASVDELYQGLEKALMSLCGYDRVIFSLMSDHHSIGLPAGHGIMRNYPDDWMRHYIEKGYEHIDPVRRFGFRHVGPFIWDSLPLVTSLHPKQIVCMEECRSAGFHFGAAICLRGVDGELGGLGVASSAPSGRQSDTEARYRLGVLNVIATQFYTAFVALNQRGGTPPAGSPVVLTQRELEVLRLMARALKDDAIAGDLGISRHAVDFHVRNILRKFATSSRLSAVIKAIGTGILPLESASLLRR